MCSCIVQTASVPQVQMSPTYSTCRAQVGAQKKVDCSGRGCGVGARAGTAARQRPMLDVPGTALRLAWRRTVRVSRWRVDSGTGSNSVVTPARSVGDGAKPRTATPGPAASTVHAATAEATWPRPLTEARRPGRCAAPHQASGD